MLAAAGAPAALEALASFNMSMALFGKERYTSVDLIVGIVSADEMDSVKGEGGGEGGGVEAVESALIPSSSFSSASFTTLTFKRVGTGGGGAVVGSGGGGRATRIAFALELICCRHF